MFKTIQFRENTNINKFCDISVFYLERYFNDNYNIYLHIHYKIPLLFSGMCMCTCFAIKVFNTILIIIPSHVLIIKTAISAFNLINVAW